MSARHQFFTVGETVVPTATKHRTEPGGATPTGTPAPTPPRKAAVPLPVFEPTAGPLTLTLTREDRRTQISAAGEVDSCSAPRLAAALGRALADGAREVAVDLHAVTVLTSAGVHALAAACRDAAPAGARLRVAASRPAVRRPLELSGLWQRVGAGRDPGCPHQAA